MWTYRDGGDSHSLHSGVSEQVPQGRAYLCGDQVVGGARDSGGDVLYGFCSHVMNYGIILWGKHTNWSKIFLSFTFTSENSTKQAILIGL